MILQYGEAQRERLRQHRTRMVTKTIKSNGFPRFPYIPCGQTHEVTQNFLEIFLLVFMTFNSRTNHKMGLNIYPLPHCQYPQSWGAVLIQPYSCIWPLWHPINWCIKTRKPPQHIEISESTVSLIWSHHIRGGMISPRIHLIGGNVGVNNPCLIHSSNSLVIFVDNRNEDKVNLIKMCMKFGIHFLPISGGNHWVTKVERLYRYLNKVHHILSVYAQTRSAAL